MTTYLYSAYQSLNSHTNRIFQIAKPHVSDLSNSFSTTFNNLKVTGSLAAKNLLNSSFSYSCLVYQKAKSHLFTLINPFSSKTKSASIVTAVASKYFFNSSYSNSCLVGLLTFCGLKIYQFKKDKDLKTLALNKKNLDQEKANAKSNAQIIKLVLNFKQDQISKILNSKEGEPLFEQKKQIENACSYFNTYATNLTIYLIRPNFKDRLDFFLMFQSGDKKALFKD